MFKNIKASSVNITDAVEKGMPKTEKGNPSRAIFGNSFISKLTEGNTTNNFFLADQDSTPVAALNSGSGLATSMIDTSGGVQLKILRHVPYTVDNDGKYAIAWDIMGKAVTWGDAYKRQYKELVGGWGMEGKELSDKQEKEIIDATTKEVGFDLYQLPGVKIGDVAMIPIITVDKGDFDEMHDVDGVMASEDKYLPSYTKKIAAKELDADEDDVRKTFAFTVLPNDPMKTLDKNHYGDEMKLEDKVFMPDILSAAKSSQEHSRGNNEILKAALAAATINPEEPNGTK